MIQFTEKGYQLWPVLLFFLCQCSSSTPRQLLVQGETMGTSYSVKIVSEKPINLERLKPEIQQIVDRIDGLMSNWKSDSDVSRFGRQPAHESMDISGETVKVLEIALKVAQATDGAFDPTIGPLIELWGFGTEDRGSFPDQEAIAASLIHTGYQKMSIEGRQLKKIDPQLTINLGSVAKGFALDQIAAYLDANHFTDYLIDIGRELRGKGVNLHGDPWQVAIENPDPAASKRLLQIVSLKNQSIATSGDYRQYFEYQGRQYSHIIDPRTGWPIQSKVTLASVIAPNCAWADAWATACMVLPPEQSLALVEAQPNLECLLVLRKADGQFEIKTSSGMGHYLMKRIEP